MLSLAQLPWLLPPPADFRDQCRALNAETTDMVATLRGLARYALDNSDALALSRAVARLKGQGADLGDLQHFRLALISNGTMDIALPALTAAGIRHGFLFDIVLGGGVGQFYQDATDPKSALRLQHLDAVVIALDHRAYGLSPMPGDLAEADEQVAQALHLLKAMCDGMRQNAGTLILQTLPAPAPRPLGNIEPALPGALGWMINEFNRRLGADAQQTGDVLLDVAHMAASAGLWAWHDQTHWNMSKLAFSPEFIPLYTDNIARLLACGQGRSRRCLVLDLDNTLWGGVVGDDGVEGVVLGQGNGTGEAFIEIQKAAKALHSQGVMLAVCSKNDAKNARAVFRSNPEMILSEDQFSAFYANWEDKASNLRAIARDLNLGLESLVFMDDNPVERALIRQALPMVAVPELPDDPANYVQVLHAGGYFETAKVTEADQDRNRHYADNARRAELREGATDVNHYLASLDMQIDIVPFSTINRARVAQLINKTNQFNLTARRTTEAEIAVFEGRADVVTMAVRLRDRFGDNGIVSALICEKKQTAWEIKTWVMSCRVFQRKVEHAILNNLALMAVRKGVHSLAASYHPTPRNSVVRELYPSLGFVGMGLQGPIEYFRLDLEQFRPLDVPILHASNPAVLQ